MGKVENGIPTPPAHASVYVEALGVDDAIKFFGTFGGSVVYVAPNPKGRSKISTELGHDYAVRLAAVVDRLPRRAPNPKDWIAKVLASRGVPVQTIARQLQVSDVSVYGYLKKGGDGSPKKRPPPQPDLFDL
ncbi:MAG: helix-turn-helix domain-containing protein, partial [Pseudomonadota bacterium]